MRTKPNLINDDKFIEQVKNRIVKISIGPSTLRGQGKGVPPKVREYLKEKINLNELEGIKKEDFIKWLDKHTEQLSNVANWGAARKSLNIFLFEACHNIYLSESYKLSRIIEFLETPLDNYAAREIIKNTNGSRLWWKSIKSLKKENSDKIQANAIKYAEKENLPARCYLELKLWKR